MLTETKFSGNNNGGRGVETTIDDGDDDFIEKGAQALNAYANAAHIDGVVAAEAGAVQIDHIEDFVNQGGGIIAVAAECLLQHELS